MKDEKVEQIDIQQMNTEGQKVVDDFMEKSIKYTPEAILSSIKEFYFHMKNNTDLFENVKAQLIAASVALYYAPQYPFAEGEKVVPSGLISYSQFTQAINDDVIEKVAVGADGQKAMFVNMDGGRGEVNLFNDPNLFKII